MPLKPPEPPPCPQIYGANHIFGAAAVCVWGGGKIGLGCCCCFELCLDTLFLTSRKHAPNTMSTYLIQMTNRWQAYLPCPRDPKRSEGQQLAKLELEINPLSLTSIATQARSRNHMLLPHPLCSGMLSSPSACADPVYKSPWAKHCQNKCEKPKPLVAHNGTSNGRGGKGSGGRRGISIHIFGLTTLVPSLALQQN